MNRNGYASLATSSGYGDHSEDESDYSRQKKSKPRGTGSSTEKSGLLAEPQNVKNKNVYVFSDGTVANHEDETIELGLMTQRGATAGNYNSDKSTSEEIICKEIPLTHEDTLQSISIKYRCPITDIKRVNGFYADQEFYACTVIKIPVRSHQVLLQQELDAAVLEREAGSNLLTKVKSSLDIVSSETSETDDEGRLSASTDPRYVDGMLQLHSDPEDAEAYTLLDRQRHHNKHSKSSKRDKRKFDKILNRKDEELKVLSEKVQQQTTSSDTVTALIDDSNQVNLVRRRETCLSTFHLSVPCLAVSFVIVIVAAGLIFYFNYNWHSNSENR